MTMMLEKVITMVSVMIGIVPDATNTAFQTVVGISRDRDGVVSAVRCVLNMLPAKAWKLLNDFHAFSCLLVQHNYARLVFSCALATDAPQRKTLLFRLVTSKRESAIGLYLHSQYHQVI
jgi:hypothetical protein